MILRFFDIILSFISLVILTPILIPAFLILKFTGEGEGFFIQKRLGKSGEMFKLLKFATMLKNSPNIGSKTVTLKNDPRVLPFGKFLRKTKINELPQLYNVLIGDMSLIGPRPQDQRCFDAFPNCSKLAITRVKPGLSGIGSIVFRRENELMGLSENHDDLYDNVIMPYKGKLEEWFVLNNTTKNYILLIFTTIWVVVFPNSKIVWKLFPKLPAPPTTLASALNYN